MREMAIRYQVGEMAVTWDKWSARNGNEIPSRRNGRIREMAIRYQVGEMAVTLEKWQ